MKLIKASTELISKASARIIIRGQENLKCFPRYMKDARSGLSKKKFKDQLVMSSVALRREDTAGTLLFSKTL